MDSLMYLGRAFQNLGAANTIAGDEGCVKDAVTARRNAFSSNIRAREIVWIFFI